MANSELVEEETLPTYHPDLYYPVSIGQTLHKRYQVLAKLGFGSESTIWLAKDYTKYLTPCTDATHSFLTLADGDFKAIDLSPSKSTQ